VSDLRSFLGETPELDAVIGLLSERLDKGVTFERFRDQVKNYVLKNYKKAEEKNYQKMMTSVRQNLKFRSGSINGF